MTSTPPPSEPRILEHRDGFWVLFKPSGYAAHPASDRTIPDLVSWTSQQDELPQPLHPAHRLDRHTSGLVLMSDDPGVLGELGKLFQEHRIEKEYRALVIGRTRAKGKIDRPLKDPRRGHKLDALTHYRTLKTYHRVSYLSVHPSTGRKHQIRRHLHGIGHAIVGDERYRPKKFVSVPAFPGRLWLHAHRLEMPNGDVFECPLPPELNDHLAVLEERWG